MEKTQQLEDIAANLDDISLILDESIYEGLDEAIRCAASASEQPV